MTGDVSGPIHNLPVPHVESLKQPVQPRMSLDNAKIVLNKFIREDFSNSETLVGNESMNEALSVITGSIFERDPNLVASEDGKRGIIHLNSSVVTPDGHRFTNNSLNIEYGDYAQNIPHTDIDPQELFFQAVTNDESQILDLTLQYPDEAHPAGRLTANFSDEEGKVISANAYNPQELQYNANTRAWEPYSGVFPENRISALRNGARGLQYLCEALLQHEETIPKPTVPLASIVTPEIIDAIHANPRAEHTRAVPLALPESLPQARPVTTESVPTEKKLHNLLPRLLRGKSRDPQSQQNQESVTAESEAQRIDAVCQLLIREVHPHVVSQTARRKQEILLQSTLGIRTEGIFTRMNLSGEQLEEYFVSSNGTRIELNQEQTAIVIDAIQNLTNPWNVTEADIMQIDLADRDRQRLKVTLEETSAWGTRELSYLLDKDPDSSVLSAPRTDANNPDTYIIAREADSKNFQVIGTRDHLQVITQTGLIDMDTFIAQKQYHDFYEVDPLKDMFYQRKRS